MKLANTMVARALDQLDAKVIPDAHPASQELTREFGDHTFFLDQNGLKLSDIQQVIGGLKLLEGAKSFLDELRSIVQVITDPGHPVMAGMPERAAVFVDASPVFETTEGFAGTVLARYPESGSPLLAGYLIGDQHLSGRIAALDVRVGEGHAVLLGFRPQWRGQPFGTFRVLFNALIYGAMRGSGPQ